MGGDAEVDTVGAYIPRSVPHRSPGCTLAVALLKESVGLLEALDLLDVRGPVCRRQCIELACPAQDVQHIRRRVRMRDRAARRKAEVGNAAGELVLRDPLRYERLECADIVHGLDWRRWVVVAAVAAAAAAVAAVLLLVVVVLW